jgi:xylose isomerase
MSLAMIEILGAGGLGTGGFNFDTKLRRQSIDRIDLFHGHVGAMDTIARALLVAQAVIEDGRLEAMRNDRYARWDDDLGRRIANGDLSLSQLRDEVVRRDLRPAPTSGRQEALENLLNHHIWTT